VLEPSKAQRLWVTQGEHYPCHLADGYKPDFKLFANLKLFSHMVTKNSAVDVKWRAAIFYAHALSVSASRRACTLIHIAGALIAGCHPQSRLDYCL
jgi:hypothetical protein